MRSASIRPLAVFSLLAGCAAATATVLAWIVARVLFGVSSDTSITMSASVGAMVLLFLCAGAWAGRHSFRFGAEAIVQRLGAQPLVEDNPLHGNLRHVAEETAIAAGIPAPILYVLPGIPINALTLGSSPSAAVLLVTRGALEQLDMEELRGLVAHELAHVFRGDNAVNTRLAGLLHGFLWPRALQHRLRQRYQDGSPAREGSDAGRSAKIGAFPKALASRRGRRSGGRRAGFLLTLPLDLVLALMAHAAAPWVRLSWLFVPPRRDYLADALAVRFTGDREGLGRVLRRITGEERMTLPGGHAAAIEHFLFAPSRLRWSTSRINAHFAERVRRLYGRSMPRIGTAGMLESMYLRQIDASASSSSRIVCSQESEEHLRTLPRAGPYAAPPVSGIGEAHGETVATASRTTSMTSVNAPALAEAAPDASVLAYRETVPGAPEYGRATEGLSWFSFQVAADLGSTDDRAARQLEVLAGWSRSPSFDDQRAGRWLGLLVAGVAESPGGSEAGIGPERQSLSADTAESDSAEPGSSSDCPDAALRWILSPKGAPWRMPLFELLLARTRGWSHARRRALLEQCRRVVSNRARDDPSAWVYYTLAQHRLSLACPDSAGTPRTLVSRFDQSRALAILFAMASILAEASARNTRDALADAAMLLTISPPAATPERVSAIELTRSLEILSALPAFSKPILLKVLGRLARSQHVPLYQAFLRAVAAAIDCPAPRMVGRRRVPARITMSGSFGSESDEPSGQKRASLV